MGHTAASFDSPVPILEKRSQWRVRRRPARRAGNFGGLSSGISREGGYKGWSVHGGHDVCRKLERKFAFWEREHCEEKA